MANSNEASDFPWIDQTLQGNVRSFSNLIAAYQDRIYTFIAKSIGNREDAKDITQNVFMNAFSNLTKFRKDSSFKTWLYRIAINHVKNYWRDRKNRFVIAEAELKPVIEEYGKRKEISDAEKEKESVETRQIVDDLLSFLPLEHKQIFVLHYVAGYTCEEIAEIFKTSASNIKLRLFRGRRHLFNKFNGIFK